MSAAIDVRPGFGKRLLKRPSAVVCGGFLLLVIGAAVAAPIFLSGVSTNQAGDLLHVRENPSAAHLLGTDTLGRDELKLLLVGTRATMLAVFEALLVSSILSIPLGLAAGYFRGRFDRIVGWWIDIGMSIPSLILILVTVSIFPKNLLAAMIALGVLNAPRQARIVRAATLPVREELYVSAARVSGLSHPYIIVRHVVPRIAGVLLVQMSLFAGAAVGITAGLSFLGVLDPSVPTWGGMFQDGMKTLIIQPWLIWPPGLAIALTGLGFTIFGDSVRDTIVEAWTQPASRSRPKRERISVRRGDDMGTSIRPPRPEALLSVSQLTVKFPSSAGAVTVVDDVTFDVGRGEVVGIVGESGCGKTMLAMAILGLLPAGGQISSGAVGYGGMDLSKVGERKLERIRGKEIALISQEPMVSLNPTLRVGWQIGELVRRHHKMSPSAARERTLDLLRLVQLPNPKTVARQYIHELSGGMAQRVAIARALAGEPKLLIADEPTTALDVTVQAEILDLLRDLRSEQNMSILLVTHDWGVVADICDRAIVMYAGEVVENSDIHSIFDRPLHPYTQALLASNPHHASGARMLPTIPGSVPRPGSWPSGCRFNPRCIRTSDACREAAIPLLTPILDHEARCIHTVDALAAP